MKRCPKTQFSTPFGHTIANTSHQNTIDLGYTIFNVSVFFESLKFFIYLQYEL